MGKNQTTTANGRQQGVKDALNFLLDALTQPETLARDLQDDDEGQEVSLEDAQECFAFYKSEMMKRGILDSTIPTDFPVCSTTRLQVTTAVKFDGLKLKNWIDETYGPLGGINFRIEFGMYTEAFLLKYYPNDAEQRAKRFKRITLFIAPYLTMPFTILTSGAKAYNLGGLEP